MTKAEKPAKASQKVKHNHRHYCNQRHNNKKYIKLNRRKGIEANAKLNVNMDMQMNMRVNMKMKIKIKMNVKKNMNMNMKINRDENLNEYEFGHECHDACEEEYGLLTQR
jgi:hypothetical protein